MRRQKLTLLVATILFSVTSFAQKIITGQVLDAASDDPISGATISEKTSNTSVVTAADGKYKITVPDDAKILIFNFGGYRKEEMDIKALNIINVKMHESSGISLEDYSVIGSRNKSRTKEQTPVAVDVIPVSEVLNQTGQVELNQIMHYVVPSFNANRQTGADLADHVDPSSLRGFGPDQVLFLVNGKRYHPSAIINVFGVRGRGNAGTDLNAIPASAVERIEVLRDGAAAQYGSDAVAGVVNIVLKSNQKGGSGGLSYGTNLTGWGSSLNYADKGQYLSSSTDGGMLNANATYGFTVGKGNLSITGDYLSKGGTLRPNNETIFPDKNYRNGAGDAQLNSTSLFFNGNFPLSKGEIYTNGGYNKRNTDSYIWNIDFSDTTRNVYEIYNKPYQPHLKTAIGNLTSTIGYRSNFGDWNADISNTFGSNDVKIYTEGTLNPSLLAKSPTSFFNGNQKFSQNSLDIDISRKFEKVNVAFGGEYRSENYQILRGDEASWKTYNNAPFQLTDPTTGSKYLATKIGTSQGFPGIRPEQEVSGKRNNLGVYTDIEWDVNNKFLLAGALRYENYSDFGGTFGGKLATRYAFTDKFALRASIQTGFRAPSLTQIFFQSTINDVDANGNNFEKIIANNRSELTKRANIPSLTAEKSFNQSFGLVFSPDKNVQFSIDGYHVAVKNRIVLSGTFFADDNAIGKELKDLNVKAAQFFLNALNTSTIGLDITAKYYVEIGKGSLNLNLAGNVNKMELTKVNVPTRLTGKEDKVISPRELQMIVSSAPQSKFHASIAYKLNKLSLTARATYYSGINIIGTNGNLGFYEDLDKLYKTQKDKWLETVTQVYKPRVVTDLALGYDISTKIKLTLGGNNILDVYPTIQDSGASDGGATWDGVQMGMGGAYFYSKLALKF
jgi:iron complex outermembrane recepter protein